jgi:hypothetical protein
MLTISRKYLASSGNKAAEKAGKQVDATREQLMSAAQKAYSSASKTGGAGFASVTSYLAKQTDSAKDSVFDTWSESGLFPMNMPNLQVNPFYRAQELPRFIWIQGTPRVHQERTCRMGSKPEKLLPIRHNHTSKYIVG